MPFWVERTDKERRAHPLAVIFGVPVAFLILLASSFALWSGAAAIGVEALSAFFGFILITKIGFLFWPELLLAAILFAITLCLQAARLGWVGWGACLIIGAFGAITFNFSLYAFLAVVSETPREITIRDPGGVASMLALIGAYGATIGLFYWIWLRWLQPRAFINRVQRRWS